MCQSILHPLAYCISPLPFTSEFGVRFPVSAVWKKQKMFLPHPRMKVSIVGSLRDREVACLASDRQGSNFESCVWRTVSSQSSHHPQAQFNRYVHKGGLKPDSFHFHFVYCIYFLIIDIRGGGPGAVVKAACLKKSEIAGLSPALAFKFQRNQMFLPRSLVKIQWPRGSVLGLRPPGLEFRIMCLDDSVISFIRPQEVLLIQFSLYVHKCGL